MGVLPGNGTDRLRPALCRRQAAARKLLALESTGGGTLTQSDRPREAAASARFQGWNQVRTAVRNVAFGGDRALRPMLVAGVVASASSLLSTVLVARLLSTSGYGALAKLLGLFLVLSLPGTALMVGVVRRVTAWEAGGLTGDVRAFVAKVHHRGFAFVAVLVVGVWLARSPISHAMRLPASSALVSTIAAGGVWILVAMDRGLLQSRRQYRSLAANVVTEGAMRTAGMIVLPAAGLGLQGAAAGLLLGELAAAAHVRWALARGSDAPQEALVEPDRARVLDLHSGRDLVADVVVATVSMGLLAALQNADIIEFGSRSPGHSGAYAAISVPAKALVFLALLLANYLLPESSILYHQGRHALRQLGQLLAVLCLPAVFLLAVAVVAPSRFLGIVFGTRYEGAAAGLVPLVLAMVFLSASILLTIYLLSIGWRWVALPLLAGTGVLAALCWVVGKSAVDTARVDLAVQAGLAGVLALALARRHRALARPPALFEAVPVEPPRLELLGGRRQQHPSWTAQEVPETASVRDHDTEVIG